MIVQYNVFRVNKQVGLHFAARLTEEQAQFFKSSFFLLHYSPQEFFSARVLFYLAA